jgi:hypothetical protein
MRIDARLQRGRQIIPTGRAQRLGYPVGRRQACEMPLVQPLLVAPAIVRAVWPMTVEDSASARRVAPGRIGIDFQPVNLNCL